MAITRIKNNQIFDNTINGGSKILDTSIPGGKLVNDLTYGSNLTISGNLIVTGATTTVDTTSTSIEDAVILLASNQTGAPTTDIGWVGERGTDTNVAFVWKEADDEFVLGYTTSDAVTNIIAVSSLANLSVSNLTAASITGDLALTALLADSVVFTNATQQLSSSANLSFDGATLGLTGILEVDGLTLDGTAVSSNAAMTIVSGANGNISITPDGTGVTNVTDLVFTGLATDQIVFTGLDSAATVSSNLTFDGTALVVTGSAQVDEVLIDGATISSTVVDSNLVLAPNGTGSVDVSTSKIINIVDPTADQDAATKKYVDDQIGAGGNQLVLDDTSIVIVDDGIAAGSITTTVDATAVVVTTAASTTFTQVVTVAGSLAVDNVTIDGNTVSTSAGNLVLGSATGVIQVGGEPNEVFYAGAAGELAGDTTFTWNGSTLAVDGTVDATTVEAGALTLATDTISVTGNLVLDPTANVIVDTATATQVFYAGAAKELIGSAALTYDGTTLVSTGGVTGGDVTMSGTSVSSDGALAITSGADGDITITPDGNGVVTIDNLQIAGATTPYRVIFTDANGDLTTDGNLTFDGDDLVVSPLGTATFANVIIAGSTINTIDTDLTLTISANGTGELYVDRNVTVSGNLSVLGTTTTVNSTVVMIQDPIIELGRGENGAALTANDGKDRGVRLWYYDTPATAEKSAWMGYDHPTHEFRYFDNAVVTDEEVTGELGHIRVGQITLIGDLDPITGGGTWVQIDTGSITSGGALQIISGLDEDITINANGLGKVVIPSGDQFRVADLDVDRMVFTTTAGELTSSANLTFNGTALVLVGSAKVDNVTIDGTSITSDAALSIASGTDEDVTITGTGLGVVIIEGVSVDGATIATTGVDANLVLAPNGTGSINASTSKITNVVDPTADQDAATKAYVDGAIGSGGYQITQGDTTVAIADAGTGTVTTTVDGNVVIVTTEAATTFSQDVVIADATPTQVFFAGAGSELTGSANLTFSGTELAVIGGVDATTVTGGNITLSGDSVTGTGAVTIASAANGNIDITPNGTGVTNITNLQIAGLDANRVVVTNATGALVDSDSFTFDTTTNALVLAGSAKVDNVTIDGATVSVDTDATISATGNITLSPTADVIVGTATATRVFYAGTNNELVGDANFTYNAGAMAVVGSATVDNVVIDGADVTSNTGKLTVNSAAGDVDFVVSGDTNANLFVVDAGADAVVIGSGTVTTDATFKIDATDSMMIPVGSTLERPDVGVAGMMRFNDVISDVEFFDGTVWKPTATEFTLIASQTFNGDDSTSAFTLSESATTASVIVSINGVIQLPTVSYSVSGTTLTFTEAPATGDVIEARRLTTTTTFSLEVVNSAETARLTASESGAFLEVTGDLIPTVNEGYDLGSPTFLWNELHLSGSTIYLGGKQIKVDSVTGEFGFFAADGTTPAAINAVLSADVEVDGGEY